MAVIEFNDDSEDVTATHAEVHGEWVVARIQGENDNINRHCIPQDRIKQIVGHSSGDDLTLE